MRFYDEDFNERLNGRPGDPTLTNARIPKITQNPESSEMVEMIELTATTEFHI